MIQSKIAPHLTDAAAMAPDEGERGASAPISPPIAFPPHPWPPPPLSGRGHREEDKKESQPCSVRAAPLLSWRLVWGSPAVACVVLPSAVETMAKSFRQRVAVKPAAPWPARLPACRAAHPRSPLCHRATCPPGRRLPTVCRAWPPCRRGQRRWFLTRRSPGSRIAARAIWNWSANGCARYNSAQPHVGCNRQEAHAAGALRSAK
jgi:hypothetical protein